MDKTLAKIIVGTVLFGGARATYLKTKDGQEFQNPQIEHLEGKHMGSFGVADPSEQDQTFIIKLKDVDVIY